jgi:hypothetical protein
MALQRALELARFLRQHIYGRSRMPSLSALLQRQFRPMAPLPLRRDSLLISQPDWFESRVQTMKVSLYQRAVECFERLRVLPAYV